MAKFTVTLYEIGDQVVIAGGDFDGLSGKVVDWGRISKDEADMIVQLDKPHEHVAKTETKMADGSMVTRSEDVVVTRVDVKVSQLAAV